MKLSIRTTATPRQQEPHHGLNGDAVSTPVSIAINPVDTRSGGVQFYATFGVSVDFFGPGITFEMVCEMSVQDGDGNKLAIWTFDGTYDAYARTGSGTWGNPLGVAVLPTPNEAGDNWQGAYPAPSYRDIVWNTPGMGAFVNVEATVYSDTFLVVVPDGAQFSLDSFQFTVSGAPLEGDYHPAPNPYGYLPLGVRAFSRFAGRPKAYFAATNTTAEDNWWSTGHLEVNGNIAPTEFNGNFYSWNHGRHDHYDLTLPFPYDQFFQYSPWGADSTVWIETYHWDWGDGNTTTVTDPAGAVATAEHDYEESGTYLVTLTVTDNLGGSHSYAVEFVIEITTATGLLDAVYEEATNEVWAFYVREDALRARRSLLDTFEDVTAEATVFNGAVAAFKALKDANRLLCVFSDDSALYVAVSDDSGFIWGEPVLTLEGYALAGATLSEDGSTIHVLALQGTTPTRLILKETGSGWELDQSGTSSGVTLADKAALLWDGVVHRLLVQDGDDLSLYQSSDELRTFS